MKSGLQVKFLLYMYNCIAINYKQFRVSRLLAEMLVNDRLGERLREERERIGELSRTGPGAATGSCRLSVPS